jgi:hypothetical protein
MVIATELKVLSEIPLLAVLTFHTETGKSDFSINASVANGLIDILAKFLSGETKPS